MHGGKRAGAGRKPYKVAAKRPEGTDPIEFLHAMMNAQILDIDGNRFDSEDITLVMRAQAARDLLPYLYPRLSTVDLSDSELERAEIKGVIKLVKPKSGS